MTNQEFDTYGDGYAAGKLKVHEEIRAWRPHGSGCGCEPCLTVPAVVKTLLSDPDIQVDVDVPPGWKVSVSIEERDE